MEMSESDYRANKAVLYTTTSTKQFVRALVNMYCFGQEDLVNYPVMRQRIRAIMRRVASRDDYRTSHRDNVVTDVTTDILSVLMVVKRVYAGDEFFDQWMMWDGSEIENEIDWFLVRKGVIVSREDEIVADDDDEIVTQVEHLAIDEKEEDVDEPKQIENLPIKEQQDEVSTSTLGEVKNPKGRKSTYICLRD